MLLMIMGEPDEPTPPTLLELALLCPPLVRPTPSPTASAIATMTAIHVEIIRNVRLLNLRPGTCVVCVPISAVSSL